MLSSLRYLLLVVTLWAGGAVADSRIVAIGDVHGDYDQFVRVLREAELTNKRNRWIGGTTTLVQLGDIPDRGPDSRKAMDLLMKLEKQARRAGGAVEALIGNHESMVMQGDLRYVHPGEYAAFKSSKSQKLLDRYYEYVVAATQAALPEEEWPLFDAAHRDAWMDRHPPGFVELRQAFAPDGTYGRWVLEHDTVLRRGSSIFLHGGLSEAMIGLSVEEINEQIRSELRATEQLGDDALSWRQDGPLWYRGLANLPETAENEAMVDRILAAFEVKRIVVGHTPRLRAVLPRFSGKVLLIDVGLSAHYGSGLAWVEINDGEAVIMHRGERLAVPVDRGGKLQYLRKIESLVDDPAPVRAFTARWLSAGAAAATPPTPSS